MNELQISKTDIKKALILALFVPIGCFIGGFSTAKFFEADFNSASNSATINAVAQKSSLMNITPQADVSTIMGSTVEASTIIEEADPSKKLVTISENKKEPLETKEVIVASLESMPVTETASQAGSAIQTQTVFSELTGKFRDIKPQYSIDPEKPFAIQAGVFSVYKNAASLQSGLLARGIDTDIFAAEYNFNPVYRVVLDRYESKNTAREAILTLRKRYNIGLSLTRLDDNVTNDNLMNKVALN